AGRDRRQFVEEPVTTNRLQHFGTSGLAGLLDRPFLVRHLRLSQLGELGFEPGDTLCLALGRPGALFPDLQRLLALRSQGCVALGTRLHGRHRGLSGRIWGALGRDGISNGGIRHCVSGGGGPALRQAFQESESDDSEELALELEPSVGCGSGAIIFANSALAALSASTSRATRSITSGRIPTFSRA